MIERLHLSTLMCAVSLLFACAGQPKDPIQAGNEALEQGELDVAETQARLALAEHPERREALEIMSQARRSRAKQALDSGNLQDAFAQFKGAATVEPSRRKRAADWSSAADLAVDLALANDAIECAEKSIEADPTSLEVRRKVANLHDEAGNAKGAIPHYLYVWEADRDDTNLGLRLAQLYLNQERYVDAQAIYQSVLESSKDNTQALLGLAECHERQGKKTKAKRVYAKLVKSHPENAGVLFRYADFLERIDQKRASDKWRKRAEKLLPGVKRRKMRKLR